MGADKGKKEKGDVLKAQERPTSGTFKTAEHSGK